MKRLVLNFPGFETTAALHQIERLTAGGHKTAQLWNFDLTADTPYEIEAEQKTIATFTANADKWQSSTRYVQFSWADIIEDYETIAYPKNLFRHLPAFLAFFLDGTVFKYFQTSGRYFGFTIYPLIYMIACLMLAFFAFSFIGFSWITTIALSIVALLALVKVPGDRFHVNLSVNDWAFARDLALQNSPSIENRFDLFAEQLTEEIKNSDADEVLIIGHSFGSVWAVEALSRALEKTPNLLAKKRVTFFALGSSLLKIALVKRAAFLRQSVETVLRVKTLVWHEIQTKTDFVSFYKSDPFEPLGIVPPKSEVIIHRVKFKDALSKQRLRKMKKSMYLAHRQYILYCDQRVHHDSQLRIFGPFFADDLARDVNLAIDSDLIT